MRAGAGLDNAILGFLNADERKVDAKRIAQLLAHGAHALRAPEEEANKEGEAFAQEVLPTSHCHNSISSKSCLTTRKVCLAGLPQLVDLLLGPRLLSCRSTDLHPESCIFVTMI